MKSVQDDVPKQQNLSEMLDALETGILHLGQERNQLRQRLEALRGKRAVQPTRNGRKPRRTKKASGSARKTPPKPPEVEENEPKAPRKTRIALGRTLSQLRAIREPDHS